jgi:hypothetical protein
MREDGRLTQPHITHGIDHKDNQQKVNSDNLFGEREQACKIEQVESDQGDQ